MGLQLGLSAIGRPMLKRGLEDVADVGTVDQGSQLAVLAVRNGTVCVIIGTSSAMIAARASTSSSCIRVVRTPISERCSSDSSSAPRSAFKRLALGAHFERNFLRCFHWIRAFAAMINLRNNISLSARKMKYYFNN